MRNGQANENEKPGHYLSKLILHVNLIAVLDDKETRTFVVEYNKLSNI
jgi:hypothetical protein